MQDNEGSSPNAEADARSPQARDFAHSVAELVRILDARARKKGLAATVNLALITAVMEAGVWMIFDTAQVVSETTKAELVANAARVRLEWDFSSQMELREVRTTGEATQK